MKFLVLSLIAISSVNAFAAEKALKCVAEYRGVMTAQRNYIKASERVFDYGVYTASFMHSMAVELIAQPNARVGGYGYSVRSNANIIENSFNSLIGGAKTKEELLQEAMLTLEDCLYGVETEASDTTVE